MTDETLKPCPFCGGKAELKYEMGNEVWGQSWLAGCTECGICARRFYGSNSWSSNEAADKMAQSNAIAAWNTRA